MKQKERLQQAYNIHAEAHMYMGYLICDGEEDLLAFRKWVLLRERKAVNRFKKETNEKITDYNQIEICLNCKHRRKLGIIHICNLKRKDIHLNDNCDKFEVQMK